MAGEIATRTVLVIDDDDLLRQTLHDLLRDGGYDVLVAGDGQEGIELAEKSRIDLIVCDLFMPGKEGIETILELRQSLPAAKIIAISGGGSFNDDGRILDWNLRAATQLGADGALQKPIRRDALLNLAEKLLSGAL